MPTLCDTIFLAAQVPAPNPADTIPNLPPTEVLHFIVTPGDPGSLIALATWTTPVRFD